MDEHTSVDVLINDASAFRAWLTAHDADAVVGCARDGYGCPVALWLREQVQEATRVIGPWLWVGRSPMLDAPEWIRVFTCAIDVTAREALLGIDVPVTAAQALAVFDTSVGVIGL